MGVLLQKSTTFGAQSSPKPSEAIINNPQAKRKTMKIRSLVILATTLLLSTAVGANNNDGATKVKVQNGEKWWGLVVEPSSLTIPFERAFAVATEDFSPTLYKANMLLSNRGRYVWSASPLRVGFDGKSLTINSADGSKVEVQKSGRTLREAYLMCCHRNFPPKAVEATATLFQKPIYEFGGEDAMLYNQQSVIDFATMLLHRGAPSGTILLPMGWNSTSGDFVFDHEAYPNPKAMIDSLHSKGMEVMLTITPYVMAAGRGYRQNLKDGNLMLGSNNQPVVFQSRMGYTACRTLSPETIATIEQQLLTLTEQVGIDGFYFDCLDAVALLKDDKAQLTDYLTLWNSLGKNIDVAIFSTPMGQQLGSTASSVSASRHYTWATLAESLERAIDASVLGFTRTSLAADLDFHGGDQNLALRTAQLAALLPVAIIPYSVWNIPSKADELCCLLAWRAENGAYYLALAEQSATSAEPILRHLEYQFPRTGFSNCRDEFMIGTKWLVAPVVDNSGVRMVRLPKGRWKELDSGRIIKGPRVIDVNVTDGKVPIYEKVDK